MFPSITIFDKSISMYNLLIIVGLIFCLLYIIGICKKKKINDNEIIKVLLIGFIGVFIGGHLLYALTRIDLIILFISKIDRVDSFNLFIDCMFEIFGGSVFYGGLIGGLITSYIYIKKVKLDINMISDLCAPLIPLFHTFGRIGCFLTGCCYGIESKIGFTYKHSMIELANGVNRFPVQLLEGFYNLLLFILLTMLYKKSKYKGKLIYLYLVLYPIGRFILEFFRGDDYRGFIFGLSVSQLISILLLIFSLSTLIINYLKNKKASR